jgi:hypothetical protein
MTEPRPAPCDRAALLALHYGEAAPAEQARLRGHVAGCAECSSYLALLGEVEGSLLAWTDEAPPAGVWQEIRARVAGSAPRPAPLRSWGRAAELLALLPGMAVGLTLAWLLAGGLASLPFWPWLAQWAAVQYLGAFGVALVMLALLGGLGSLALAPALVLDSRRE